MRKVQKVKISAVMPKSFRYDEEKKNIDIALSYIDKAADMGTKIISLPEGFPGPYTGEVNWDASPKICEKAKEREVYVIFGGVERANEKNKNLFCLTEKIANPNGKIVATYRRMQPDHPDIGHALMNGKDILPGEDFCILETEYGNIGLLICSEIWCPELPRILALSGADIIYAPIGGLVYELTKAWKNLLWTRALENHVYVVASQNLYGMEEGICMIAGPEEILAERSEEGIITVDIDLDRLDWLREHDQNLELPKQYKSIPGSYKYRRPEKYKKLVEPDPRAYDFYLLARGKQK